MLVLLTAPYGENANEESEECEPHVARIAAGLLGGIFSLKFLRVPASKNKDDEGDEDNGEIMFVVHLEVSARVTLSHHNFFFIHHLVYITTYNCLIHKTSPHMSDKHPEIILSTVKCI